MATLEELQAQRQRTIADIQARRKAGQTATPELDKRLASVEAQIRQMRGPAQQQPANQPPQLASIPKQIDNVQQGVAADIAVSDIAADKSIGYQNPNITNPFGSQTVTRGPDGSVNVNQTLDPKQQAIVDSGSAVSQRGLDQAFDRLSGFAGDFNPQLAARQNADQYGTLSGQFNPTLTARTATGDLVADRARIEDTVFKNLTRNMDRDYSREKDNLEQSLANRGIPINPQDPAYQRAMESLNERFDGQRQNAMAQAVQMGGDEYGRSVGIGETMRANDFSQAQGVDNANMGRVSTRFNMGETANANDLQNQMAVRGQNYNEMAGMSGLGPGARLPQFQPYQAPAYQLNPATTINTAISNIAQGNKQLSQADRQLQAQIAAMGRSGGGGGSSGGTTGGAPTPPAFPMV